MGCTQSVEDKDAKRRNAEIEIQLKRDADKMAKEIKMLLLGAGESGKSTVLKQMRLIYNKPYSKDERDSYREIIYWNTVQSMRTLLEGMEMMGIELEHSANHARAERIKTAQILVEGERMTEKSEDSCERFARHLAEAIFFLWNDKGVQDAFVRRNEIQLNDSAEYFFKDIKRIKSSGFEPTDQDILRARVKTTGITETHFQIGELTYKLFDVGGQRSERRKWLGIFENVTALVFLIAINEYDQRLYEDETVNRMQEAMTLFESVINSRWFIKTTIILFLNKRDLFQAKLPLSPLSNTFPDYRDGNDFKKACQFLKDKFLSLRHDPEKHVYPHFTDATDTDGLTFVVSAVNDVIIQENLRKCGLM